MMNRQHAWSTDPARDAAVRAAQDGRTGPLPTLEEAISRAGQFTPPEPPQGRKCTERERQAASGGAEPVAWQVFYPVVGGEDWTLYNVETNVGDSVNGELATRVIPLYAKVPK
jgi:hypothetical protein